MYFKKKKEGGVPHCRGTSLICGSSERLCVLAYIHYASSRGTNSSWTVITQKRRSVFTSVYVSPSYREQAGFPFFFLIGRLLDLLAL